MQRPWHDVKGPITTQLETEMKLTPDELADQFSNLSKADFQTFWMHVLFLCEESDLDAQWFYYSQGAKPEIGTVISAMHSAVYSGINSGASR